MKQPITVDKRFMLVHTILFAIALFFMIRKSIILNLITVYQCDTNEKQYFYVSPDKFNKVKKIIYN